MTDRPRIIAMIPARRGSQRLKQKNLVLLNGRPLISYAVEAAKQAKIFDEIVINSEDDIFSRMADELGVAFYQRESSLASSQAKSDEVVNDFITHNSCDMLAWVNSTSPLQTGEEINRVVTYFRDNQLDSLITVKDEQVHCLYNNKPLNFDPAESFARTQDLEPVQPFVYSVMMWRSAAFQKHYQKHGHAILCGKMGFYPVGKLSSMIIKKEEDLRLAEYILAGMDARKDFKLHYAGQES